MESLLCMKFFLEKSWISVRHLEHTVQHCPLFLKRCEHLKSVLDIVAMKINMS